MLELVLTNLGRHKARTLATALGIALGVATIVALLSVGSGLRRTADQLVHLGQADLGVFQSGVADPTASLLPVGLARRLERRPDVAEATPLLLVVEAVRQDPAAIVFGADRRGFFARRLVVTAGDK
ncbi:MAG TPA: ABC transporter permease, partial [Solirubrobacteraceae bacterium]|nr:ABC transporter permease [Solirubrobacteraceae bacterium]